MTEKKIIYDFGSNNGDDIPYYLLRSDLVVAVEANPELCTSIRGRFAKEISNGRLVVVNCVISNDASRTETLFYIHKTHHVRSQLPKPTERVDEFTEVTLPSATAVSIIERYGPPYYVKIDIEYYDGPVLQDLFSHNIFPPYISAESHDVSVFATLVTLGGYDAFKLVDGDSVARVYKDRHLHTDGGVICYSFPDHSAGPFGEDVDGPWMTANAFLRVLAFEGMGWKDVHATNRVAADPAIVASEWGYFRRFLSNAFKARLPQPLKRLLPGCFPAPSRWSRPRSGSSSGR